MSVCHEQLRDALTYAPETGEFYHARKLSPMSRARVGARAGGARQDGYWAIRFDGKLIGAHRLAWIHFHGVEPSGQIDHINGDKHDNRIVNLRDVSASQNKQNMRVARSDNSSKLIGAHKMTGVNQWKAQIRVDGKLKYLGTFASSEMAHEAYVVAKRQMHPAGTL